MVKLIKRLNENQKSGIKKVNFGLKKVELIFFQKLKSKTNTSSTNNNFLVKEMS